jgi:hypothetical protein
MGGSKADMEATNMEKYLAPFRKKNPIRWRPVRRSVTIETELSQPMCLSVVSFLTKTVSINVIFMLFSPCILSIYSVINLSLMSVTQTKLFRQIPSEY